MITQSKKDAIVEMKKTGMSLRKIAKTLKVSRNAVRNVIKDGGNEKPEKESQYEEYVPLIRELFKECRGNAVRVGEELEKPLWL